MNNSNFLGIARPHGLYLGLLVWLAVSVLAGCTMSPKTYFYSLQGFNGQTVVAKAQLDASKAYGVGPVFLPEPLLQPGVVSHVGGQQLDVSLYSVWAGNLQDAVTRVLAANIAELGQVDAVWPFPWDNRSRPTRQIRIVFEQFSGAIGGAVVLKAKWALTENNGETVLLQKREHLTKTAAGNDYGHYVEALNLLINELSANIVADLARLDAAGVQALPVTSMSLSDSNQDEVPANALVF
ncbi:MAG: PqiC family protein [Marinagarivorans sp.]|nr:PqiC family protein [Marinagarivorans sp.]